MTAHPATQTCQECGAVEVVRPDGRGFPPDIAKRRLAKRCRQAGHVSRPTYRAGLLTGPSLDLPARDAKVREPECGACGCTPTATCDESCDGRQEDDGNGWRCVACRRAFAPEPQPEGGPLPAVLARLTSLPDGWDVDVDTDEQGGQPNGCGEVEPSDYRDWYTVERESHHRERIVIEAYGPWQEGPTESARKHQQARKPQPEGGEG